MAVTKKEMVGESKLTKCQSPHLLLCLEVDDKRRKRSHLKQMSTIDSTWFDILC